jgi:hypothetical protein
MGRSKDQSLGWSQSCLYLFFPNSLPVLDTKLPEPAGPEILGEQQSWTASLTYQAQEALPLLTQTGDPGTTKRAGPSVSALGISVCLSVVSGTWMADV